MKHIFTVHSPITFFVAYSIIQQLNLQENDVIIIAAGYTPPLSVGKTVKAYQDEEIGFIKKLINLNLPKAYDKYIDDITGGNSFTAYIDLMHAYQRILVTHPKCKEFAFMEEGLASYILPDTLDFLTHGAKQVGFRTRRKKDFWISMRRILRGVNMRLLSLPYAPQAYSYLPDIKYYTFSTDGYPGIKEELKKLLHPNPNNDRLKQLAQIQPLKNAVVWIEEAFPRVFGVPESEYKQAIDFMIERLKSDGHQKVYIKLRPKQTKEESLVYESLVANDIKTKVLPADCVAEALVLTSKKLVLIGIVSSLLYYGVIWGHEAYSIYNKIDGKPATNFDDLESFWKKVVKL